MGDPVFATERLNKIKQILLEYKKANVSNLSEILSVSEVTIRKDLERLENEGFLTKIHGGAVLNELSPLDTPHHLVEIPELEYKRMIGVIGAHMVQQNEAIFIGSGTTCLQIAKNLKERKDLTVVTNNVSVAVELSRSSFVGVILTGGDVKAEEFTQSVVGAKTIEAIQGIYVEKAFVGVDGISTKRGYTVQDPKDATVIAEICRSSNELIVVADHTKFNKITLTQIGEMNIAHKVITDELAPEEYMQFYFENNIPIFTTYRLE